MIFLLDPYVILIDKDCISCESTPLPKRRELTVFLIVSPTFQTQQYSTYLSAPAQHMSFTDTTSA